MRVLWLAIHLLLSAHALPCSGQVSEIGVTLVKQFEGFSPTAYMDAGRRAIGYGHHGPDVLWTTRWTEKHADEVLRLELGIIALRICAEFPELELTDNQLAALTSHAYNVGLGRVIGGRTAAALRAGDLHQVHRRLEKWTKSEGVELQGLIRRRAAERQLFMLPD